MRTQDDRWDITTSVGATALAVAVGRAIESDRDDALVRDPHAQAFVDVAGSALPLPDDPAADDVLVQQAAYQGVRSRFFDEALTAGVRAGIRQVVLLAAGLDVRAYRLDWPSETAVFEVDQSGVLEFKDRVLADRGAEPRTGRTPVTVDLREDWPAALRASGFDPSRPTAWLAEGLLPYLPADAETLLFERVQELSAPGSRIAVEHFGDALPKITDSERFGSMTARLIGTDVKTLFFDGPRGERPDAWLTAHGWSVHGEKVAAVAEGYGRPLDGDVREAMGDIELLRAELTGAA